MKVTILPPQETPEWAGQYITTGAIRWAMKLGTRDFTINQKQLCECTPANVGADFEQELRNLVRGEK
jgi:hypothetical protein